jgi:hypothetical protein
MDAASDFRTGLTEDLQSRQQRALLSAIKLGGRHARQAMRAKRRLDRAPAATYARRHAIRPAEEYLDLDATRS